MPIGSAIKSIAHWVLDFALPPRCAGCGVIVDEVHSFCADCWKQIEVLGSAGCVTCGTPLEATAAERCALCLAKPPRIGRTRAAVVYDDLSRSLALRLKYGRKVAVTKTMARYMAPLVGDHPDGAVLVPVPLHRGRLWQRGFNQSGIIARELGRRTGLETNTIGAAAYQADAAAQGDEPAAAAAGGGGGIQGRRRDGRGRANGGSGRRRADHRKHRQRLRAGIAAGRSGPR
jgi:predicted amidophosphoribosyltransferase